MQTSIISLCADIPCPGDPFEHSPAAYALLLQERSDVLHDRVRDYLRHIEFIDELRAVIAPHAVGDHQVQIVTTGSDARQEKKGDSTSPLEVVALWDSIPEVEGLRREIIAEVELLLEGTGVFGNTEVKDLSRNHIAYFREETRELSSSLIWPSRIIEAEALTDTPSGLLEVARTMLYTEMMTPAGKTILDAVKHRMRDYRGICKNEGRARVKGRDIRHFDPHEGMLYYSRDDVYVNGSVKYGPMRATQMYLIKKLLEYVRNGKATMSELLTIPGNTVRKIDVLSDMKVLPLSPSARADLIQIYMYFLWCYCLSEHTYSVLGQKEAAVPDPKMFQEHLADVLKILEL